VLTSEERAWLAAHPVIVIRPTPDHGPLEFYDDQGVHRGITADYLDLIQRRLGFRFQILYADPGPTRPVGDVRALLARTPERENHWLFTEPYLELPTYLITRASAAEGLTLADLAGARVAVVGTYAARAFVEERYPDVLVDPVLDNRTGLRKVSFGLVDAFVSDLAVATFWMEKEGITNLKVAGETGHVYRMGMASRRDWPEMRDILEKGLALVTPAEREEIYGRWVRISPRPGLGRRFTIGAMVAIAAALLAFAGVLLWNRTLQQRVARRTRELEVLNQALRASEERLLTFFRLSPIPMSIATLEEGRIVFVNDAYARLGGYAREEIIGRTVVELGFVDAATRQELVRSYQESGTIRNREMRIRVRSGEYRTLLFSADILLLEGAPHLLVAAFDITDYRRLQDELRQAQKMEAIGQLAGGVAHDFNNMLMAITAHCDVLALEVGDGRSAPPEPVRQALEDIQHVAGKAAHLTRQLLTFSRKQSLQPRTLDLNVVVEGWQRLLRRLIGSAVEIRFLPGEGLGRVEGDPGALEQVLMNLCLNARDAMPEGGILTISTVNETLEHPLHTPHGEVAPGRYVSLAVTDTGEGMDASTRERIFEPFFTTKPAGRGTGLGLSTVYGIVGQSGGSVLVTSEVGAGSTFRILLPRSDGTPDVAEEPVAPAPAGGTETILLVEDDDDVQQMAAEYLQSVGYTVLTARNAGEAADRMNGGAAVDLLLTDVDLPGASGPRLARRLAAERPGLKVLFISGQAYFALEKHGVSPGDILEKPFPLAVLAERIRLALDRDQPLPPRRSERKEK
jgi:PAS domain S-box-containing protein